MTGYGVDPLVECRVELCYDVLLPMRTHKPKEYLGLVDRILCNAMRTPNHENVIYT